MRFIRRSSIRVLPAFRAAIAGVPLTAPQVPFYSAVLGTRADDRSVTDAELWVRQIREPVLFGPAVQALFDDGFTAIVEGGPGGTLAGLARRCGAKGIDNYPRRGGRGRARDGVSPARRWRGAGAADGARSVVAGRRRRRMGESLRPAMSPRPVPLPTYPFERTRHWIEPLRPGTTRENAHVPSPQVADESLGFVLPTWRRLRVEAAGRPRTGAGRRTRTRRDAMSGRWRIFGGVDDERDRISSSRVFARPARTSVSRVDGEEDFTGIERVLVASTLVCARRRWIRIADPHRERRWRARASSSMRSSR